MAGKDFPKLAEIQLDNRYDPDRVVASVANGDGGEFAHYLITPAGTVTKITDFADRIVAVTSGPDDALYLVSQQGTRRAANCSSSRRACTELSRAELIVPESDAVIQGGGEFGGEPVVVTPHALYVREIRRRPVARRHLRSRRQAAAAICRCRASRRSPRSSPSGDGTLLYSVADVSAAAVLLPLRGANGARRRDSPWHRPVPRHFADTEVVREFARSKDGTAVPLNIITPQGHATGLAPIRSCSRATAATASISTPNFLGPADAAVARWRRGVRHRQLARRRRVRRGLARAGRADPQAERVRRLPRGGPIPDRSQLHRRPRTWPSSAAATADC